MAKIQSNTPLDIIISGNTIFTADSSGIIVTGSFNSTIPVATSSYAETASFVTTAQTASFVTTAQTASFVNTLNQNVLITGSLTIGSSSVGSSENTLIVGLPPNGGVGEGGQILLQAPNSGGYTSASMFDNYQNNTRLLRGNNAGSDAIVAQWNMHTKQMSIPQYNSVTAFSGVPVATLGVDSNGNIITTMPFTSSYLINTQTTSAGVDTTINNLTFTTSANQVWSFEANFIGQCSGTGGVRFTVVYSAVPISSSVFYRGNGASAAAETQTTTILTTPVQSATFWSVATSDLAARIWGSFANGASANTVTIKVQPTNGAQTATIRAMSYLTARRII